MTTYAALREEVWRANLEIVEAGLVVLTWGNVSGADREAGVMAIKPSGLPSARLRPEDIVVMSLATGNVVDGALRPSSDTPTHLHLYREFDFVRGIVHTHSRHAVAWAQAERDIPCFGTTHSDHFRGAVPVTRRLSEVEIADGYEHQTGAVIVECFRSRGVDPMHVPAALVACHGPFVWGESVSNAVENAVALEAAAGIALETIALNPGAGPIEQPLLEKHHDRKHGVNAYYGQG